MRTKRGRELLKLIWPARYRCDVLIFVLYFCIFGLLAVREIKDHSIQGQGRTILRPRNLAFRPTPRIDIPEYHLGLKLSIWLFRVSQ